jgi:hypothetical protein
MRRLITVTVLVAAVTILFAGMAFAIVLRGGNGPDTLVGTPKADKLYGAKGPDELRGRAGKDILHGGKGPDVCVGGPGDDIFRSCETKQQ